VTRRTALALLVALAAVLTGCDADRRAISRDDLPDVPAEPTESVELDEDGFGTEELEITTEDLVEFRNAGNDDHGVRTDDHRIDTGLLLPGESTYVVFDEPGRYEVLDVADDDATMVVIARAPPPES
jgi:plastocyanin